MDDPDYNSLDEAGKRAFNDMYNGLTDITAAVTTAISKWLEWRENRLNKTETTDSE